MKTNVFVFIFFFFTSLNAQTTYYFSTSGNDANDGLTTSSAKQTLSALQTLLDISKPGDKFLLKRGDTWTTRGGAQTPYSGVVGLDLKNLKGTQTNPIIIGAYGTGNKPIFNFSGAGACFQMTGCTYTTVEDLFLTSTQADKHNRPSWGFHGIGNPGGHDMTFLRVKIDNLGEGYRIQDGNLTYTWDSCDTRNTFGGWDYLFTAGSGIFANVSNLTIKNSVWINNGLNNPSDPGHEHGLYLSNCDNVIIENNQFLNSYSAMVLPNCNNLIVRGNIIKNMEGNAIGLYARNYDSGGDTPADLSENLLCERNYISDCGYGISLNTHEGITSSIMDNITIKNNIITNCNTFGGLLVEQFYKITGLYIYNNTFYNNYPASLRLTHGGAYTNVIVKNNILYNDSYNTATLLEISDISDLSSITSDNNLFYATVGTQTEIGGTARTLVQLQQALSRELNSIYSNPLFVSSPDEFSIGAGSPAIDGGYTIATVTDDFNGNLRPSGKGYDIGAYEFGATTGPLPTSDTKLNIKILLEGPFNNGDMSTELSTEGDLPLNQPYNVDPWNYDGTESVSSIPSGVVDWVLLELRSGTSFSTIVSRKAAFVKNDGSVVDLDGISQVSFNSVSAGNYYVVVMHRNHLAVMSANAVSLSSNSALYDFTTSSSKAYGTNALADLGGGKWGLYAGDSDRNGTINVLDYGNVVNFLFDTGYKFGDLDLNGIINVLDYSKTNSNLFKTSQVPN